MFKFIKTRVTQFDFDFPENDLFQLSGICNISVGIGIPETDPQAPVKCRIVVLYQSHAEDEFYLKMVATSDFSSDTVFADRNEYCKAVNSECVPIAIDKVRTLISSTTKQFYGFPVVLPVGADDNWGGY